MMSEWYENNVLCVNNKYYRISDILEHVPPEELVEYADHKECALHNVHKYIIECGEEIH